MPRSVITIDDLSDLELEQVFDLADDLLARMGDPARPYRIRGRDKLADQYILSTLFFEPSTRTRFSFESAMQRLGGGVISSPNSSATSSAKGESIADTVRVVENYADVIVIRHSSEGAARVAADYASVPVINAGDGSHEHPTQTLCDLYTLRKERGMKSLKEFAGLNIVLYGDLKHGRTVHSLVYALARLGASIILVPAKGLELPEHVTRRLQRDYHCAAAVPEKIPTARDLPVDMIYVTPKGPHQQTIYGYLEAPAELKNVLSEIHVFYVTRLQTERVGDGGGRGPYQKIDNEFMKKKSYKDSRVMHPLPRVGELGYDLDDDPRGIYFKQAAYGVTVRMALLTWLLDLKKTGNLPAAHEPDLPDYRHKDGITCENPACVTKLSTEQQYLAPDFWIVEQKDAIVLRCKFCEYEYGVACFGRVSKREYYQDPAQLKAVPRNDRIMFARVEDAVKAGYASCMEPAATTPA
jgi:aspartate carbamoyltransferase catalytic subunit